MPQTILEGTSDLSTLLSDRRYMLVCGNSFRHQPLYTQLASNAAVVFGGFSPNPLYEQVLDGIHIFNGNHCDAIVAAGGGSALDVAKCIKLYCHTVALHDEAQALSNTPSEFNFLLQEKSDTGIPLFAIPTTAGTGSESTRHAVIYYQGVKQSISHPSIVPDVAILEPSLLKSLPLYQKKCTMMDALCQAIESTWSVNSTDESKGFARQVRDLQAWAEQIAEWGREKQRRFLGYMHHVVRESFIRNLKQPDLCYTTAREAEFLGRFSPYVNERNVEGFTKEIDSAARDNAQNANARMVFFDLALHCLVLVRK